MKHKQNYEILGTSPTLVPRNFSNKVLTNLVVCDSGCVNVVIDTDGLPVFDVDDDVVVVDDLT